MLMLLLPAYEGDRFFLFIFICFLSPTSYLEKHLIVKFTSLCEPTWRRTQNVDDFSLPHLLLSLFIPFPLFGVIQEVQSPFFPGHAQTQAQAEQKG